VAREGSPPRRRRQVDFVVEDGKQRWSVTREAESADWTLAGSKERPDLQKATDLASSLGWVNLVDVVADPAKADTGLDHAIVSRPILRRPELYAESRQAGGRQLLRRP